MSSSSYLHENLHSKKDSILPKGDLTVIAFLLMKNIQNEIFINYFSTINT
ncbi:hypothetical protein bthur0004_54840 [Bacillus thuringiensis serovar sotto str. T04001]|nr:hypothetical protein bthur0004_54840 [Bacillus thuringiensis serovar sotto str. T04001]